MLPSDIILIIDSFIPKKKKEPVSPSFEKQITKIQNMKLKGKSANYLKGFEDFCLD